MSAEEIDKAANDMIDSQMFQKPGDLVERDDDTGLMQVESMCMNCHDNVSLVPCAISNAPRRRRLRKSIRSILTSLAGRNPSAAHPHPLLPRCYPRVVRMPPLPLQEQLYQVGRSDPGKRLLVHSHH